MKEQRDRQTNRHRQMQRHKDTEIQRHRERPRTLSQEIG